MVDLAELLFAVAVIAGGGCLGLGVLSYRRAGEPGSTAFGVFLALWGGIPTAMFVAGGFYEPLYPITQLSLWCLATVSWFVFALQYTGSYTRIRPLTTAVLAAPTLVIIPWQWGPLADGESILLAATVSLVFAFYSTLALVGGGLVLRVALTYGHLSVRHGVVLALCGIVPMVANTIIGSVLDEAGTTVFSASLFAVGFLAVFLLSATALLRIGMFETTLAAGTLGERAIARETDDLIVITDDDGRILRWNEAARTELDTETDQLGEPLPAVLNTDIEALTASDTIELSTDGGVRTFDPRVTALTDQHDRRLGSMVSLRDITEREIRRQRLEVLNRIMRHNLRNEVSVIEAHTELVADEVGDDELREHLETAVDSAGSLATLGAKAGEIEDLLGSDRQPSEFTLVACLERVVDDLADQWPDATVRFSETPAASVVGDRTLLAFVLETLGERMLEQGASSVEFSALFDDQREESLLTVAVTGQGATLPQQEVEVLQDGTETALKHARGIGLWVATWAVTDCGGELTVLQSGPEKTVVSVGLPYEQSKQTDT